MNSIKQRISNSTYSRILFLCYWLAGILVLACGPDVANGQPALKVAGSPAYHIDPGAGFVNVTVPAIPGDAVNNSGTAIGTGGFVFPSNQRVGTRGTRWSTTDIALELFPISENPNNSISDSRAYAINDSGVTVGSGRKYAIATSLGSRAVRWSGTSQFPTELGNLGTDNNEIASAVARAVNNAGTAAGISLKYQAGVSKGTRAVRWNAGGTAATELATLGVNSSGSATSVANAINESGVIVGNSQKYVGGNLKGQYAVRWDAGEVAATELSTLGLSLAGVGSANAIALNNAGTTIGSSLKYDSGLTKGTRAVRWNSGGTAITELAVLRDNGEGVSNSSAIDISETGITVGWSEKYVLGTYLGQRAVRWDPVSSAVTELSALSLDDTGTANSYAYAVNDAGTALGYSSYYVANVLQGNHAVAWLPSNAVIDLNDLGVVPIPAEGTWILQTAKALSADGWAAGEGLFDPDGSGPTPSYARSWVGQIGLGGNWLNSSGLNNTWGKGTNWSSGTPAIQLDAIFNINAAYTVVFDDSKTARNVYIAAGNVNFQMGGRTLTVGETLTIEPNGALQGNIRLVGNVNNAGTLLPGNSAGGFLVQGNLHNTGTLELEIAGLNSFDEVNLTGLFTAGGTIKIALLGGYQPSLGDRFDLLDFNSFLDAGYAFDFSNANLQNGLAWDTSAFADTGALQVIPVPEPTTIGCCIFVLGSFIWYVKQRRLACRTMRQALLIIA